MTLRPHQILSDPKPWRFMAVIGFALAAWAYAWGNEFDIIALCVAIGVVGGLAIAIDKVRGRKS